MYGLKHHIVEMRGGVTDAGRTNNRRTVKIELLSQWKLEAEFRNFCMVQLSIIWYFWDFVLHGIIWYCLAMSWKHLQHFSVAHESQVGGSGTVKVLGCRTKLAAGVGCQSSSKRLNHERWLLLKSRPLQCACPLPSSWCYSSDEKCGR